MPEHSKLAENCNLAELFYRKSVFGNVSLPTLCFWFSPCYLYSACFHTSLLGKGGVWVPRRYLPAFEVEFVQDWWDQSWRHVSKCQNNIKLGYSGAEAPLSVEITC